MPISKEDALKAAAERDAGPYAKLCETIDDGIRQSTGTGNSISISIRNTPRHLLDRAKGEYEKLGWSVHITSEQREGTHLHLS